MKNKHKPNSPKIEPTVKFDTKNTMYYIVGRVVTWHSQKALANLKKHGVSFEEASTVLFADSTIELEDRRHNEQRFILIGFSARARLLTVVYAYRYEDEIRIISARKATKNEAHTYEKRI